MPVESMQKNEKGLEEDQKDEMGAESQKDEENQKKDEESQKDEENQKDEKGEENQALKTHISLFVFCFVVCNNHHRPPTNQQREGQLVT